MKWVAESPGKLILLGEYAVLEGAPALVGAVARRARVTIQNSDTGFSLTSGILEDGYVPFEIDSHGSVMFTRRLSELDEGRLQLFRACMKETARTLQDAEAVLVPANIELDTTAFFLEKPPLKLGLGSSAALTVSLMAGLLARAGLIDTRVPDKNLLLRKAMSAHCSAQSNTGSGVDIAASTLGGVFQYKRNGHPLDPVLTTRPFHLPRDLFTVAVWTGKSASTPELVEVVNGLKARDSVRYNLVMDRMKVLADEGVKAIGDSETGKFLEVVSEYFESMRQLGEASGAPIISKPHAEIARICHEEKVAYKPSGAGGGDLGILFSCEESRLAHVLRRLEAAGFPVFDLQIGTHGVQVKRFDEA